MRNTLYIILAGCLWGIIALFIHCLHGIGFDSMQCVAVRAVFTALMLFGYLMVTDREKLKIEIRDIRYFIGTGIFSILFFNYCYFQAIEVIGGAAIPALLMYTSPIFVMVLSAMFFGEKITVHKVIALVVTFVGLGYALYSILGKLVVDKYDAKTITFYTFFVASLGAVPLSGVIGQRGLLMQPKSLLVIFGLAFCSTVLPFLLYTKGLKGVEAGKAAILATIEPFVAGMVGAVWFGEKFTVAKVTGMVMILGAIVYLNGGGKVRC